MQERAARLFSVKGAREADIPRAILEKPKKEKAEVHTRVAAAHMHARTHKLMCARA